MPSSVPTQPPSQTEESPDQASTSGEASGETGEQAQQTSDAASASESEGEAGESPQSESSRADGAQEASSAAADAEGSTGEAAERGDTADAAGQLGVGDTERGSEQQQAGASGEAEGAESATASSHGASASRLGRDPSAGERAAEGAAAGSGSGSGAEAAAEPGERPGAFAGSRQRAAASRSPTESGEPGGAGHEGAPGDPSETAGGGIPIDDVPPELLAAFGRGGTGTATEALSGEALQRALERLAEHQGQVDEMIQHEQSAAAASSGDIGTDSRGTAASAPPLKGGQGGRRAENIGDENATSVSTASTDAATDAGAGHRPPADVGSGSDDDTLAAQLRELAMKETDPVLRERYWEEYRKHKGIK